MALDQECLPPVGKKCLQEEDKKAEKNSLPSNFSSLKKRSEFLHVRKAGKTTYGRYFIVNYNISNNVNSSFGFTVSKKIGSSVVRNYLKRILREIVKKNLQIIPNNLNIEIIPKKGIEKKKFQILEHDLVHIFRNLVI